MADRFLGSFKSGEKGITSKEQRDAAAKRFKDVKVNNRTRKGKQTKRKKQVFENAPPSLESLFISQSAATERVKRKKAQEAANKKAQKQAQTQQFLFSKKGISTVQDITLSKKLEKSPFRRTTVNIPARVTAAKIPESKFQSYMNNINKSKGILKTRIIRNKIKGKSTVKDEATLFAVALTSNIVSNVKGVIDIPKVAKYFRNNPTEIKKIPSEIKKSAFQFGKVLRYNPTEAMGIIAGEVVFLKGSSSAISKAGKLKANVLTRLNPKFKGVLKAGALINLGEGSTLRVVAKIPKETLKQQVSRAGKTVDAISSQADSLLKFVKPKKGVRKPISPKESSFSKKTLKLLEKFDKGTITSAETTALNSLIKKEGAKGLLERSFFADPTGKIRPSRLGVTDTKSAKLIDYISGNITFKKAKPQILLFRNLKVQNFPKTNVFKSIKKKLSANKPLTAVESDALLKFQLQRTGKFKPVGFVSGESEITLPAGEILKRKKIAGVTLIKGKRVPIIEVEVFKPSSKLKSLLKKLDDGLLSEKQIRSLDNSLKRQTGLNYGLSSKPSVRAKYVSIKQLTGVSSSRVLRARRYKKPIKAVSSTVVKKPVKSSLKRPVRKPSKPSIVRGRSRLSSSALISRVRSPVRASSASQAKSILVSRLRLLEKASGSKTTPSKLLRKKPSTKTEIKKLQSIVKQAPKVYRPSFAAILLGITAYKVPKNITGTSIRPIVVKRK